MSEETKDKNDDGEMFFKITGVFSRTPSILIFYLLSTCFTPA